MSHKKLYQQPLFHHLLVEALNRHDDRPCFYLDARIASYVDVHHATQPDSVGVAVKRFE